MMRLLLLLYMLAFSGASAAELIAEVQARMDQPALLRGQFEQQKNVAGFRKPLISTGDFLIWRGHGVLWHTRKPFDSTLVLRRDRLMISQAGSSYSMDSVREPGLRAVNELLFALFSGDVASMQSHFSIEGTLSGKNEWNLILTPSSAGLAQIFRRVELAGDRHVRSMKLEETSGDSSLIRFVKQSETPPATLDEAAHLGN